MHTEKSLQKEAENQLEIRFRLFQISRRKGIFHDARQTLLQARPYRLWQTIHGYLRRFRTISFLFRLTGWIVMILQTGTLVLLTTAVFFIILPLLAVLLGGGLLIALLDLRRAKRRLCSTLNGKTVYVFFGEPGNFGLGTMQEFAARENCAVLAVSPLWLSPNGLNQRRFYVNVRQDGERLFLIRRYFFYALRKQLPADSRTVLIY